MYLRQYFKYLFKVKGHHHLIISKADGRRETWPMRETIKNFKCYFFWIAIYNQGNGQKDEKNTKQLTTKYEIL